jgi:predicted GNAT family acetyltransferase
MATLEETLRSLGLSAARGIPQLATGFVDLAALPFTATGLLKPEQAVGSTAYLTSKGLLPPEQQGLLNQTTELLSSAMNPAVVTKAALAKGGLLMAAPTTFNIIKRDASDIFGAGAEKIRYIDPNSGGNIEVLSKPDRSASVLSLEVPEQFRGKKIGESLQARVLQDFPEMQGQVSSKAAAKTAYRLGRRPVGQPNATLDDVFKAIDQDSSVNLVSAEMQKRFAGTQPSGLLGQQAMQAGSGFAGTTLPFGKGIVNEKIGNSTISYQLGDDNILKIFSLRTPQSKRGQGSATSAMEEIVNKADQYNIPITLDASPLDKKTRLNSLVDFYKKFGFEPTGQKVNAIGEPVMFRIPK